MMRALAIIAALATAAAADDQPDPEVTISYVSAELRGATATIHARYIAKLGGPTYAMSTVTLMVPDRAVATSIVVNAPDGVHRLDLVEAEKARAQFSAINDTFGEKRWAMLVEANSVSLDLSFAAPHAATFTVDIDYAMPTCYYRDARHVQLLDDWRGSISPHLRSRFGKSPELDRACNRDDSDSDELWISFPTGELARRAPGIDRVGANAARVDLGDAHIARLELMLAKQLGEAPRDLATAILVDGSRSMTPAQVEAQRELVRAYVRAAGETQVQLISYARTARALLPSWTTARTAIPRIERELAAVAPRNGSHVDVAFVEAARWLAQVQGTRRVVLVTDARLSRRLDATLETLAKLLPANTLVHVVTVDETSQLVRESDTNTAKLAEGTGGIAALSGIPEQPLDATMLVRPIRIDALEITAPGWKRFRETLETTCENTLDEGMGCTWWGEGEAVAGPLAIEGMIWGKRITRIVTPDGSRGVELARELVNMRVLDDDASDRAERVARAATRTWSFYAEWGRPGGYTFGSASFHGGHGSISTRSASVPTVTIGQVRGPLPLVDLSSQFAHVISRCQLGEAHVEAKIELTEAEIVEVHVLAPPAVARCVEDEIWDTTVTPPDPRMFRASSRIVLVQ